MKAESDLALTYKKGAKQMKRAQASLGSALLIMVCFSSVGCTSSAPKRTGFLSDYTRLEADGSTRMVYFDKAAVADYSKFVIDPIKIHFHHESSASEARAKGKLKPEDIDDIKNYMHEALKEAIRKSGYEIAYRPAPGVARIRIALTDLKKSSPALNVIPHTKLTGLGLGSAAMEAELLDSESGKQLAAVVQGQKGSVLSTSGMKTWGDAKAVIDDWAKTFAKKLDELHK